MVKLYVRVTPVRRTYGLYHDGYELLEDEPELQELYARLTARLAELTPLSPARRAAMWRAVTMMDGE